MLWVEGFWVDREWQGNLESEIVLDTVEKLYLGWSFCVDREWQDNSKSETVLGWSIEALKAFWKLPNLLNIRKLTKFKSTNYKSF